MQKKDSDSKSGDKKMTLKKIELSWSMKWRELVKQHTKETPFGILIDDKQIIRDFSDHADQMDHQCNEDFELLRELDGDQEKLATVKRNQLWMASPEDFNDPFDCNCFIMRIVSCSCLFFMSLLSI